MQRVLAGFGRADEQICIEGASGESRVGDRVTYGNFIRMMSHTIKQGACEVAVARALP